MSNEIAIRESHDLSAKVEWAKTMAVASLLPKQYQNNPGNLLYAIEYADSLGIDRINAITSIHVINGKPTASADLIAGLIRKAGHKLRVTGDDTYAVAQIIRGDDPDFTYEARWDLAKAKAANLSTPTWRQYPGAMLRSRAITEVARMGASDALYGVIYTPEELGATVDAEGAPVEHERAASPMQRLQAVVHPEPIDVTDAEVIEEPEPRSEPEPITTKQITMLNTLASKLGLDRDAKIAGISVITGRTVESSKDLTKDEARTVIDSLQTTLDERAAMDSEGQA